MQLLRPESIHVSCWDAVEENFGEQMSPKMFALELFAYCKVHLNCDNGVLVNAFETAFKTAFETAVKVCEIKQFLKSGRF